MLWPCWLSDRKGIQPVKISRSAIPEVLLEVYGGHGLTRSNVWKYRPVRRKPKVVSKSGSGCCRYVYSVKLNVARSMEKKRAIWNVGNISELSENGVKGCVRAIFDLGSSPSGPHLAALSFTCEGTTFSGVDLQLLGSGYRTSFVKKHIVSGELDWNEFNICCVRDLDV